MIFSIDWIVRRERIVKTADSDQLAVTGTPDAVIVVAGILRHRNAIDLDRRFLITATETDAQRQLGLEAWSSGIKRGSKIDRRCITSLHREPVENSDRRDTE